MSPILINASSTSPTVPPPTITSQTSQSENGAETELTEEEQEIAREERKATGRSVAIIIFISLMVLALYHVIIRKTTILAGVLVPALILFTYTFFVIHISNRDKKKRKKLQDESINDLELSVQSDSKMMHKKISTVSNPSISSASIPSTSGLSMNSIRPNFPVSKHPSASKSIHKMDKVLIDPKAITIHDLKKVPPFKKTHSQSHIQLKSNPSTAHISVENETKKLKKSRSFDRNLEPRHMIDNKKNQNKALSKPQKKSVFTSPPPPSSSAR